MVDSSTVHAITKRLARAGLLLLMCALGGTFDSINSTFTQWNGRAATAPEEEEVDGKERTALTASSHLARRGGLRPSTWHRKTTQVLLTVANDQKNQFTNSISTQPLTGAGIFQHC